MFTDIDKIYIKHLCFFQNDVIIMLNGYISIVFHLFNRKVQF